ncbi:MAG: RNA methyltransferase [Gammaproteobacteria bacterium]|nr:RNA methyltransferase [Gammaproteobacteria bacterium]
MANVRIVLVGTTHPGNIGAAARAMKTMGLSTLALVAPARYPAPEAWAMASGADDVLAAARVHATLPQALAGCASVVATSARQRSIPWPCLSPRACASTLIAAARHGPVALVFGREQTGLSNAELDLCQALVRIPTVAGFSSLNVAAAVQILSYELYAAALGGAGAEGCESDSPPATADQVERFYAHLEQVMISTGFHDPEKPRRLMRRLRRLFGRTALDQHEVQILRGLLAAMEQSVRGGR